MSRIDCPHLITVSDWSKHHSWPTVRGMRNYLAKREQNGMMQAGVVRRVGRRILIDEAAFFRWVEAQGTQGTGG